jgi:hypothetical protein
MTTHIQFLHVMREASYLEQALVNGLMFTDHPVTFRPFSDDEDAARAMANYSLGRLSEKATAMGARDLNLNELAFGLGTISGKIPMICFTEVHDSRDLFPHIMYFGAYGVVASRTWLECHGGDRVFYAGSESAVTKRLHRLFVDHQISGLHVRDGKALLDSRSLDPILDLFAYAQGRGQLAEVEWRIAGEHGFTGRRRASGERIPLPLSDVEAVLVKTNDDVPRFEAILASLAAESGAVKLPPILVQPATLPIADSRY